MTREEIIKVFNTLLILKKVDCTKDELEECCKAAIKALEQEPTPKKDLAVDAVSRADVLKLMKDNWHTHNGDWAMQESMDDIRALPSVTPIRPKGHWVLTDVEGNKVWHCHCSECGKDPQDYVGGSENWWLIKSKLPKFCPSCGSDNREVEE